MHLTYKNEFENKVFQFFCLVMDNNKVSAEDTKQPWFKKAALELIALGFEIEMMIKSGDPKCTLEEYRRLEDEFVNWWVCWG